MSGTVAMGAYTYYRIPNPNGCNSMTVLCVGTSGITTGGGSTSLSDLAANKLISTNIAIGKWPNVLPTLETKTWGGYSSFSQNFTIDAWDPAFDGGNACGADGQQACYYYIGVRGYDGTFGSYSSINFDLTITLTPQHRAFGVPQLAQLVAPGATNRYKFCINADTASPFYSPDARVNLYSFTDSCACPEAYADLQVCSLYSTGPCVIIHMTRDSLPLTGICSGIPSHDKP